MAKKSSSPLKKTQKAGKKTAAGVPQSKLRRLKRPAYKSFRLSKRIRLERQVLPSAWKLFRGCIRHLWQHKKLFLSLVLVQAILTLVFVKSFSVSASLGDTKELLESVLSGTGGRFVAGVTLFGTLLGSNSVNSNVSAIYQSVISVVMSLGLIWALRQTHVGTKLKTRDVFYKGMFPLVPFLLVLVVIALQMLPLVLANTLYGFTFGNALAVSVLEKILWALLIFLLTLLTIYMISSSIFALLIVTLPDVVPLQALRSARQLVLHRRWTVMRKLLFLPFVLLIISAGVLIPVIMFVTPLAEWLYFFMAMGGFVVSHSYIYSVYRELLV